MTPVPNGTPHMQCLPVNLLVPINHLIHSTPAAFCFILHVYTWGTVLRRRGRAGYLVVDAKPHQHLRLIGITFQTTTSHVPFLMLLSQQQTHFLSVIRNKSERHLTGAYQPAHQRITSSPQAQGFIYNSRFTSSPTLVSCWRIC